MLNGGGGLNADGLALDLQFAADKTLTARKGPNPVFTRGSTGTFVGSNGLIQTAATNIPRFDHTSAGVCRGLLIEESRTNQITFSENLTDASWSPFATASAANITSTNPSGGTTTSRLTADSGTDTGRSRVKLLNLPSASYAATVSCFVKAGNSNFGLVRMAFNKTGVGTIRACNANIVFSTGVITKSGTSNADFTVTSTAFPDGWYRITISATSNASLTVEDSVVLAVGLAFNGTGGSGTFAGTETVLAWGAQLEAGSFATSYIPTTTGSVVRSADVCTFTGADFNRFYNSTSGTLLSEASISNLIGSNRGIVQIDSGTNLSVMRHVYGLPEGGFRSLIRASGDTATELSTILGTASTIQKRIIAYEGTSFASVTNGGAVATATRTMPTGLNAMRIGNLVDGSFYLSGHIAAIRFYKKRLPNAKLVTLTT